VGFNEKYGRQMMTLCPNDMKLFNKILLFKVPTGVDFSLFSKNIHSFTRFDKDSKIIGINIAGERSLKKCLTEKP
jgi:hypothetical protein